MGPCTSDGCSEKQYAKGLCKACYSNSRYHSGRKCTYEGCAENLVAKGYCGTHYTRNHRGRDMDGRDSPRLNKKTRYTEDGLRICTMCREPQPDSNFSKTARDGLSSSCNRCQCLRAYKMTKEAFVRLLSEQNGRCAGCGTDSPGGRFNQWHIDHDHACCPSGGSCGKCVRKILCSGCNVVLGLVKDNPDTLMKLADYLISHQKQR